ncbi:MAG: hypothetical protein ABIJ48_00335 [Actinomycetota bacterium]
MLKKLGLLIVGLMLVMTACGDDDDGGLNAETQAKVDEIKAELLADTSADNPFADEATASCFANGIVGKFGLERINELDTGSGVEDGFALMSAAEQESVADLAMDCIDFQSIIKDQMAASGLPEEQATCVANALSDDLLKDLFLAEIRGEDPAESADLMEVIMGCLIP